MPCYSAPTREDRGCLPLCQRFLKFRSEVKWKGLFWFLPNVIFGITYGCGPLIWVGPVRPKFAALFLTNRFTALASLDLCLIPLGWSGLIGKFRSIFLEYWHHGHPSRKNTILGYYASFWIFGGNIFWGSQKETGASQLDALARRLAKEPPPINTGLVCVKVNILRRAIAAIQQRRGILCRTHLAQIKLWTSSQTKKLGQETEEITMNSTPTTTTSEHAASISSVQAELLRVLVVIDLIFGLVIALRNISQSILQYINTYKLYSRPKRAFKRIHAKEK